MKPPFHLTVPTSVVPVEYPDTVILGVTRSDAHVVANILIENRLTREGYHVVNLGACTPTHEFMEAYREHPDALAIAISSMNGHALEDLDDLQRLKREYGVQCPIILGGNLAVGGYRREEVEDSFKERGVSLILDSVEELIEVLARFSRERRSVPMLASSGG